MADSTAIEQITAASSSNRLAALNTPVLPTVHTAPPPPPPKTTATNSSSNAPIDLATLSTTAQATILQQQGLTVSEIAQELGLTVATIQADLGISAITTASTTTTSTSTQTSAASV